MYRRLFVLSLVALLATGLYVMRPAPGVDYLTAQQTQAFLAQHSDTVVLDVRTAREFARGHLDGAINVDYLAGDFAERVASLDRNVTYVVHCQTGPRSRRAMHILHKHGFNQLNHLNGGYKAWRKAGGPITQ